MRVTLSYLVDMHIAAIGKRRIVEKLPVTSRLKTCDFRLRLRSVLLSDIISLRLQDTYIYQS